jgi:hypothetical protein
MASATRKLGSFEKGQVLLVAILVIVIALTVGLSLVARTITNLRISTEEAQSQKALAAAEAGIERSLQSSQSVHVDTGQITYDTVITNIGGSGVGIVLNGGNPVPKDEGIDVWFEAHDAGTGKPNGVFTAPTNLKIYWGSSAACVNSSAIEVIFVTTNGTATKTYRYAYDPCSTRGNSFTTTPTVAVGSFPITSGGSTSTFASRVAVDTSSITSGDNIIFMRVVPIYKDTIIGVSNDPDSFGKLLPLQGYQIDSTGTSGEANRKIRVFKGYPQTPLVYVSYGLFVACDDANCN